MTPADNPFRTSRVAPGCLDYQCFSSGDASGDDAWRRLVGDILQQIGRPGGGCLVVGPHGSGKTTLLHRLAREIGAPPVGSRRSGPRRTPGHWIALRPGQSGRQRRRLIHDAAAQTGRDGWWIIDGLEQLTLWQRCELAAIARRSRVGMIATSHRDAAGWPLRDWPVVHRTRLDATGVRRLTMRIVQDEPPAVRDAIAAWLDRRDTGRVENLREFWMEGYDVLMRVPAAAVAGELRQG